VPPLPTLPPPSTPPNEKALAVLRAAAAVFLVHGFSAATTDMIQREARVSKATVYAHYPNKEALFIAVIEHECARMAATFRAIATAPNAISASLFELGRAYLQIVLSPIGLALFRVVAAEAPRFPDLGRSFFLAGPQNIAALVTSHIERAARAGEIDVQAVGVDAAAALFLSMLRGDSQLESLTHPDASPSAAQVDDWVRLAVTTFLLAFGKRAAKGAR